MKKDELKLATNKRQEVFEDPKLQLIRLDMKDILSASNTESTDATDPNQGIWIP